MRSLIVVLVIASACGKPKPDAVIEKYVNTDMGVAIARVLEAELVFGEIKAEDISKPTIMKDLIRAGTGLRLARESATKVVPPPGMEVLHRDFLSATGEVKSAVDGLVVAAGLGLPEKFKAAHETLMDAGRSWFSWQERFNRDMGEAHVKYVLPPNLPPLPDEAPAPTKPAVAEVKPPPPCKAGTEVKKDDKLAGCELAADFDLGAIVCTAGGKIALDETGDVLGCVMSSMFALPYETPVEKDSVVVCGPGAFTRTKAGVTTSCTIYGSVKVGDTTLAKGTLVTIGDKLAVTAATSPDGAKQCFDPAGKLTRCTP